MDQCPLNPLNPLNGTHFADKIKMDLLPSSSRLERWPAVLLGSSQKRRRITAMTALACAMMVFCTLVMRMLGIEGTGMDAKVMHWWATLAPVGLLVALVLVRSGWSERFADASLSQFQLLWALGFNAAAYVIAGPVRALALPVLVIIMMFGIFSHTRREVLFLMVYAIVVYTAAILITALLVTPGISPMVLIAQLTIVLASILTSTLMCLQVQGIRRSLQQQKKELQQALQQIQHLAMRDHLTGLINRRQMSELMALELRRCQRSGRPLLLAQLDIDHFKAINDTHGHAVGDLALQIFANTALSHLRSSDVLARWGGEEFVLLLCDTEPDAATELLERVRSAVQAHTLVHGKHSIRMTVSIGWAQHQHSETLDETLQRADQALYDAKHGGRNRVVHGLAPQQLPVPVPVPVSADGSEIAPGPLLQPAGANTQPA